MFCLVVTTFVASARVDAAACSCAMPDAFGFVAASGVLPANAKGVVWSGRTKPSVDAIKVFRLDEKGKASLVPFKIDQLGPRHKNELEYSLFLIRPTDAMTPGQRYRFVTKKHSFAGVRFGIDGGPQTREYVVSDQSLSEAADAVDLSATTAQAGTVRVSEFSGQCDNDVAAVASNVRVVLPTAWELFSEQLSYRTIVNNKPWNPKSSLCQTLIPGRPAQPTATDRIFRRCGAEGNSDAGVASKDARVVIEITAPTIDAKFLIRTIPLTVALDCPVALVEAVD